MNSNEETLESLENIFKEPSYDLDNAIIDLFEKKDDNLKEVEIAKYDEPYRETFVIPLEHIIRIENDDRS